MLACVLLGLVVPGGAGARTADGCRPLRAIFYASTGSLALAQGLAANASSCAQYYVTVPPLAADKTQIRSGVAGPIRTLGANFHALAEVNVTAWQGWVTSTGSSWYQAGVEARARMAAAGFAVSSGDSWAVNELSSAVRQGTGTSRQNTRDFVHGLFDGTGTPTRGVVFVTGIGQSTASLGAYKARLESWLQDPGFWGDMGSYVSDFVQEAYGDIREYGVPGADVPTRLGYVNAYLEHGLQLASVAPSAAASATSFLAASYAPLANAAWAWSTGFGFTASPYDQMEDYVSAQVDAMRSYDASLGWSGDRIGFAWAPSNSLGLSTADFNAQTASLLARLAAAIEASADPAAPGAGACQAPWCTVGVAGAAFTPAWSTFSSWTPTSAAFSSLPATVPAGSATGPMSLQLQIGGVAVPLPIDTSVHLSSSSPGGSFSTFSTGPWAPTLDLTIPAGSTTVTFFMLDSQAGTPTVTAATGQASSTQVEIVTAPSTPLAIGSADNSVTYAQAAPPVAVDPSLTVTDTESPTLIQATAVISSGLAAGDVLAAATAGTGITASYSAGTLTLTGSDTVANYQAVLRSVVFSGTAQAAGSRTIVWTVADGTTSAPAISTVEYIVPPPPPSDVAASAGDGQATVSFTAPGVDGGSAITSYTVTASPGGATASGPSSPITVTGLTDGTDYSFTVTSTSAAGTGPASVASGIVTPAAPGGGGSGGGSSGGGGGGGSTTPPVVTPPVAAVPVSPPVPSTGPLLPPKKALTLTVSRPKPVTLRARTPKLAVVAELSRTTTLVLTLRGPRGRILARWRKVVKGGTHALSLVLPRAARHAGTDRLEIAPSGGRPKSLIVTIRK